MSVRRESYGILKNEFAMVEVERYEDANGPRLIIRDLETGNSIALDALELEALTHLRHRDFDSLVLATVQSPDDELASLYEQFRNRRAGKGE